MCDGSFQRREQAISWRCNACSLHYGVDIDHGVEDAFCPVLYQDNDEDDVGEDDSDDYDDDPEDYEDDY